MKAAAIVCGTFESFSDAESSYDVVLGRSTSRTHHPPTVSPSSYVVGQFRL